MTITIQLPFHKKKAFTFQLNNDSILSTSQIYNTIYTPWDTTQSIFADLEKGDQVDIWEIYVQCFGFFSRQIKITALENKFKISLTQQNRKRKKYVFKDSIIADLKAIEQEGKSYGTDTKFWGPAGHQKFYIIHRDYKVMNFEAPGKVDALEKLIDKLF